MNLTLKKSFKNHLLFSFMLFALSGLIAAPAFGDVGTPRQQIALGFSDDKIICKQGYFKVKKASTEESTCVKISSVMKLLDRGWSLSIDSEKLEQAKKKPRNIVGTMETIMILKDNLRPQDATIDRTSYHYAFKVCAKDSTIRVPEVVIESDSATKKVQLANKILPNTCQTSAIKIIASDKNSIKATLSNKGGITNDISLLETKIQSLRDELSSEKKKLNDIVTEKAEGYKKEITKRNDKVIELRKELNATKEKLNRLLYAIHAPSKAKLSTLDVHKLASGKVLDELTLEKLAVTEQEIQKGIFNVAFQMCTGKELVRAPVVTVSSDSEEKKVNLANRLVPNSCQTSGTKISASNADSIEVNFSGSTARTEIITTLEGQLAELIAQIDKEKLDFEKFLVKSPVPSDFEEQAVIKATSIETLRAQINTIKAQLHGYYTQIFE